MPTHTYVEAVARWTRCSCRKSSAVEVLPARFEGGSSPVYDGQQTQYWGMCLVHTFWVGNVNHGWAMVNQVLRCAPGALKN